MRQLSFVGVHLIFIYNFMNLTLDYLTQFSQFNFEFYLV